MKKITSQVFVAIVCGFLGFLLAHQFKLLNEKNKVNLPNQNLDIIAEIDALKKEKEELINTNNDLSKQLKELEEKASSSGSVEAEIKKQLDNARMNLGLVDVKGPGITITITPKTNIFGSNTDSRSITQDEIIHVVNALRYIKAEAISINDYRLTPQTGIQSSGSATYIWIGTAGKIDPKDKIVIKAIGDKQALKVAANFIGVLDYGALRNYDCDVKESDEITINKTTQSLKNEYVKPLN